MCESSRAAPARLPKSEEEVRDGGEAAGSSLLRKVGPDEVFNLPLYEHHLVIDIRPSDEFAEGHMATAVSFPHPSLQLVL